MHAALLVGNLEVHLRNIPRDLLVANKTILMFEVRFSKYLFEVRFFIAIATYEFK